MKTSSTGRRPCRRLHLLLAAVAALLPLSAAAADAGEARIEWTLTGWWNTHSGSEYRGSFVYDVPQGGVEAIDFDSPYVWGLPGGGPAFPWHYGATAVGQRLDGELLVTDRRDSGFDAADGSPLFDVYELHVDTHTVHPEVGTVFDPADASRPYSVPISQRVTYWYRDDSDELTQFTYDQRSYAFASPALLPAIPEPGSAVLLALGLAAAALRGRRAT